MKNQNTWLDREFDLSEVFPETKTVVPGQSTSQDKGDGLKAGRPPKPFHELKPRAQRKRTETIRAAFTAEELCSAAASSLHIEGKKAAAELVLQSTKFSPFRPVKLRRIIKRSEKEEKGIPYTADEALALYIDCRLTKRDYNLIRKGARERCHNLYPSYDEIIAAKKLCYPEGTKASESG